MDDRTILAGLRVAGREASSVMDRQELLDRIKRFDRWHYEFDLAGYKTPIFDRDHINRHEQRKRYFFPPLVNLFGGSLAGKRVLDLACNAGFWSLLAVEHGCDYVLGIDGRQAHIDQANLVFEAKGIAKDRYDFRCSNVFDILQQAPGEFDIVFCLGLLYHVSKPMTLLEQVSPLNRDVLVIDTSLSRQPGAYLEIRHETLDEPRHAIDYELVMYPTQAAVLEMVRQFDYQAAILKPMFTDYTGGADYADGSRRAFVCAKVTDLAGLHVELDLVSNGISARQGGRLDGLLDFKAIELLQALGGKALRRLHRAVKTGVL